MSTNDVESPGEGAVGPQETRNDIEALIEAADYQRHLRASQPPPEDDDDEA